MIKSSHNYVMEELQNKHGSIIELISNSNFHYVDYPVHGNIGDLLIMHGTLEFFRKNNIWPTLSAPFSSYSPDWVNPNDVVVFHGGGNLGDLYHYPQQLRENVVRSCPNNRIIIMPQTIHFGSVHAWSQCKEIFNSHNDLHIFVRDTKSLELAKELTKYIYLVPDMAHHLYPITPKAIPSKGILGIQRMDGESTGINFSADTLTDWPKLVGRLRSTAIRHITYASFLSHKIGVGRIMLPLWAKLWFAYSSDLISEAVHLFSDHNTVVSDRLHAHILASLLNMPNTISDNAYGKNSNYILAWTKESPLVTLSYDIFKE